KGSAYPVADFYAARAGTNAGAPLDGFLTAVHSRQEPMDWSRPDEADIAFIRSLRQREEARTFVTPPLVLL
ncbi:hypothetical protein, partial [Bosea sp. NPDC055594]